MSEPRASVDELTALLQQLRLQQPGANSPGEVARAQTDLLLARMAALTDTLRVAEWNDTSRAGARLLLADLAMVAAQLRSNAVATGEGLTTTLEHVRQALEQTAGDERATVA